MTISTGFLQLDKVLLSPRKEIINEFGIPQNGGINIPSFIILGARTAVGKTAFLLNLALNISLKEEEKICFISLDLNSERLAERFNSIIEFDSDNSAESTNRAELIEIMDDYCTFKDLIIFIEEKRKNDGTRIFIIDYLQLFNSAQENLYEESSYI